MANKDNDFWFCNFCGKDVDKHDCMMAGGLPYCDQECNSAYWRSVNEADDSLSEGKGEE